jgi:hypothetical protein
MMSLRRSLVYAVAVVVAAPTVARADDVWDFVKLAGTNGVLGQSFLFTNGSLGSIRAFTSSGFRVTSKGYNVPIPNEEKGLGLCIWNGSRCDSGDEIGDFNSTGILYLDLTGLIGSTPLSLFLASVQAGEGWNVAFSSSATCTTGTSFGAPSSGAGPNSGAWGVNLGIASSVTCIKFTPVDNGAGGEDYLLQSLTTVQGGGSTEEVVPEPATMGLLATGLLSLGGAGRIGRRRKR